MNFSFSKILVTVMALTQFQSLDLRAQTESNSTPPMPVKPTMTPPGTQAPTTGRENRTVILNNSPKPPSAVMGVPGGHPPGSGSGARGTPGTGPGGGGNHPAGGPIGLGNVAAPSGGNPPPPGPGGMGPSGGPAGGGAGGPISGGALPPPPPPPPPPGGKLPPPPK